MAEEGGVLVTGGSGLLGRVLVDKLLGAGESVRVLSRSAAANEHERLSVHRGDVTVREDLRRAVQGCNAIFHCAAEKADSRNMMDTNVLGTRILFEQAIDAGVSFFCHVSSAVVVGKVQQRVVDEATPCSPMSLYERSKLAAERIVSVGLDRGQVVILRPTHIFGEGTLQPWLGNSPWSRVSQCLRARENSHLVYVEDVAAAAIFLRKVSGGAGVATFIVSSDDETGGTHGEVRALLSSKIESYERSSYLSVPLCIPHWLRTMRTGRSNRGDVIYSSKKLRAAGFSFPFGLREGLIHVAGVLRDRMPYSGLTR
jgi:nucleoside-diphosphate-sugar epimerase